MKEVKNIALIVHGTERWIAGVIYFEHLVSALHHSHPEIKINLLIGPRGDLKYLSKVTLNAISGYHYYSFYKTMPLWKKALSVVWCFFRNRPVQSIERIIEDTQTSFVYPNNYFLEFDIPSAAWIPDFQHKLYPEYFKGKQLVVREKLIKKLIHGSKNLVVSSNDALKHMETFYSGRKERTYVLPFSCYIEKSILQADAGNYVKKYELPDKYLIFSSQLWKHKNHLNLLKALKIVIDQGQKGVFLVLTGKMTDLRDTGYSEVISNFIKDNDLSVHVKILGLIPRFDQLQLLRYSACIIQPSYFEGWSAMIEDARSLGKKILVSDIPVHREQNPADSHFFNPSKPEELASLITTLWPQLSGGSDPESEKLAFEENGRMVKGFGEHFLEIAAMCANGNS
jgi:glycosyltransferase involved in cell wall biosynthesis